MVATGKLARFASMNSNPATGSSASPWRTRRGFFQDLLLLLEDPDPMAQLGQFGLLVGRGSVVAHPVVASGLEHPVAHGLHRASGGGGGILQRHPALTDETDALETDLGRIRRRDFPGHDGRLSARRDMVSPSGQVSTNPGSLHLFLFGQTSNPALVAIVAYSTWSISILAEPIRGVRPLDVSSRPSVLSITLSSLRASV